MKTTPLKRPMCPYDLRDKGYPFECSNCGNKPTPRQVVDHDGDCEICGYSVVSYTVDVAKMILRNEKPCVVSGD